MYCISINSIVSYLIKRCPIAPLSINQGSAVGNLSYEIYPDSFHPIISFSFFFVMCAINIYSLMFFPICLNSFVEDFDSSFVFQDKKISDLMIEN